MSDCSVEFLRENEGLTATGRWSWHCQTHRVAENGFSSRINAEAEAADHERQESYALATPASEHGRAR